MTARLHFLEHPDSQPLQQLREILHTSGYATAGITPTLDGSAPPLPAESAPDTQLNTLLRLFFASEPVSPDAADKAIHPLTLDQLTRLGILQAESNRIRASIAIQPYEELLFAFLRPTSESSLENALMFISPSSLELAHLMVRSPARTALDLGTGCGFLAALLARYCGHVYAVDVNPAAVMIAEFNCRWNSIRNVTCIEGNLFQPVRDLRFDRIVCNPPFMISPVPASSARRLRFRDSGHEGDEFCIQLAREASRFLHEDGYFHMMFQWLEIAGTDWTDRLRNSFSSLGCDVWGMRIVSQTAEDYVSEWIIELQQYMELDSESLSQAGLQSFQRQNVESVGSGLLTLRRCASRPNYLWFDEAPDDLSEPYGDTLAALFDQRAFLETCNDSALLGAILLPSPHLAMVQKSRLCNSTWQTSDTELLSESGLRYASTGINPLLAQCIATLDGSITLAAAFDRLAQSAKQHTPQLTAQLLPEIRELLLFGFLLLK